MLTNLMIEGSATCDEGLVQIRLYDGEGEGAKYLGNARGIIQGHALSAVASDITEPNHLTIRYSIQP